MQLIRCLLNVVDLRELDAVLSQSLSGITKRIEQLTDRIEGGLASLESLNANAVPATDANGPSISLNYRYYAHH
jgi:hypothetical protein